MKKITWLFCLLFVLVIPFGMVSAQAAPSVVDTTIPVDQHVIDVVNAWLTYDAPIPLPYWAITYVGEKGAGKFVSLVALNITSPTDTWHVTDDNTVAWMGSVIINPDDSVEIYSDGGQQANTGGAKLAAPALDGGGSSVSFPWQAGGSMIYGPSGVHAAGNGAYATGFSAIDFLGGDDLGSGVAPNSAYAVADGTVDYFCTDDTTTLIRTKNDETGDYYIYAHLLTNANLVTDHTFLKGSLIGFLKYGTFTDNCGYATQTAKHYHLHFGFKPAAGSFRIEGCILNMGNEKWTCGAETISTGGFLRGGGGGVSNTGDDAGVSTGQPSFWDYILTGVVTVWHNTVIAALPDHQTIEYTYVIYNAVKITLRIARVMVYSNLDLGPFMSVFFMGFSAKVLLGLAEFAVFILKAIKSLNIIGP